MCKYCELETLIEECGEKSNACQKIEEIKDGYLVSTLYFNRYIVEEDGIHISNLIIETAVELSDGVHIVKEKEIPIKYCPFCGEEL